jgi:hypothetical protein
MAVMKACMMCGSGVDVAPLLAWEFRTGTFWICAQHLPVLIHDPARLIGKLEGAEDLAPSDYHD